MPLDGFLHPSDFRVYDACEIEGYCGLHQAGAQEMSMVHRLGSSVTPYTLNWPGVGSLVLFTPRVDTNTPSVAVYVQCPLGHQQAVGLSS